MFKQFDPKVNYSEIEKRILKFWDENKVFEKSMESADGKKTYTFYEGPPTANGKPGIHHVMARSLKDLVCRYKTMQGYVVNRRAGWDTHGLPVEIEVEKKLGIKNKSEVPVYGIDKYNRACKESVFTYKDMWEQMTRRMGYWVDLKEAYVTCTNNYIESVWWALDSLYKKGLIYKDYKVVPQDPKSETPLSSHELALGYRETKDPSVYVVMKLKDSEFSAEGPTYFLVWTTTPWTLISNVALAVGSDIGYVKIKIEDEYLILAESRLGVIEKDYEIVARYKGRDLAGTSYEQLFDYCKPSKKAFYVIEADFVSTEDGSGIVHIAPAFGQDDYEVGKKYDLPLLQPVDRGCRFTGQVPDYQGRFVKDCDLDIIADLRQRGRLFKKMTITHSYPFSWRNENVPIIYYARESWFIRTTDVAPRMIELNKEINWNPKEVGSGRFGNWLEDNKDWALSRDRFWATPLPIWVSEDGDHFSVGSIEQLKEGFIEKDGKRISVRDIENIDLHKPFVDDVLFEKNGKIYKRTPELIDVWFDSGSMPFAQLHYPFENKELFEKNFPADFICEGIDQTRGWFYTLHAISTMLFNRPAFKNLIVNELILDKDGLKMSKSKGNTVNPFELFDKYGADATRWYLVTVSPPWRPTLFDEEGILEVQRKFFGTLVNTYNFFALYANVDDFKIEGETTPINERPEIDRWIISKLNSLVLEYRSLMDSYDPTKAARLLSEFTIEELSNWYVRRNRRRFWKSEVNAGKISAYETLYECLLTISKLAAPFVPFIAEELFQNLCPGSSSKHALSVHLERLPAAGYRNLELEEKMDIAQKVVYLARSMRAKNNLKIRQPLSKIIVAAEKSRRDAFMEMESIILDELNIKELEVLQDDSEIVNKSLKPNFKSLGPKFGRLANRVGALIRSLGKEDIARLEKDGKLSVDCGESGLQIGLEDVEIVSTEISGWVVETEGGLTVALDKELTEDLLAEGCAREFVNRLQNIRKEAGLLLTDRITVSIGAEEKFVGYINKFSDYISNEILADELVFGSVPGNAEELTIGDFSLRVGVKKA